MPLSPREQEVLAELEERLRVDDPATPPPSWASLRSERGAPDRGARSAARNGALLALAPILLVAAALPPAWQPAVALGLALVVAALLPRLVVRVAERFERR